MGLYNDIQTDLSSAFEGDLLDATRTVQFVTYTNVYNDTTMQNTLTESSTDVRAVKISSYEGENIDEPTKNDSVKYLVIDSDRNGVGFELDMKIVDGSDNYKVTGISTDPAGASWTISGRRWS